MANEPGTTVAVTSSAQLSYVDPGTGRTVEVNIPAVTITYQVIAAPVGPGASYPQGSGVSDQKAGSVLIYPVYTSWCREGGFSPLSKVSLLRELERAVFCFKKIERKEANSRGGRSAVLYVGGVRAVRG